MLVFDLSYMNQVRSMSRHLLPRSNEVGLDGHVREMDERPEGQLALDLGFLMDEG